jgi:transposase InsO family protein
MELAKYAVTAVLVEGRSTRAVAASTGRSKSWVARQVALFKEGGEAALEPKKRGPIVGPRHTSPELEDEIIMLRKQLGENGFDAGAKTLTYYLSQHHDHVPSLVTIHRILVRRGFVTPQPQKRPRSSWTRFESDLPNECWQSDMTHWQLEDDTPVEIINFIDDYSRAVLCSSVVSVAKAADVVRLFYEAADNYGFPASVLSDNGAIYTNAYRGGHSALEIDLGVLGITFKHGKPYHPQTQGKVERYHQTLKKWLRKQPPAPTMARLQAQIDGFVRIYNEERPHQARGCPPMHAWRTLDKATPIIAGQRIDAKTRVRYDLVDSSGKVTIRYKRRLHHIGLGRAHTGCRVIILMADLDVRVITGSGELLRHFTFDPTRDYQSAGRSSL